MINSVIRNLIVLCLLQVFVPFSLLGQERSDLDGRYIYGGATIVPVKKGQRSLKCALYSFKGLIGDSLQLLQYGEHPFVNIARIGGPMACICIGDTVKLQFDAIKKSDGQFRSQEEDLFLDWLKNWGKVGDNDIFHLRKHFRRRSLTRGSWLSDLVIVEGYVYQVHSSGLIKRYNSRGLTGDDCRSCEKIDPNL